MKYLIITTLLLTTPLVGKPLFENSVVSNDIDFIKSDDPSVPFKVSETARGRREMPDKRNNQLFLDQVFTFSLLYEDGTGVKIWASPEFNESKAAAHYVSFIGAALGKQPTALRKKLSHVVLHKGDETAYAEEEGRFFVLYSENIEKRVSTHDLEETVFHETIHATLEAEHAKNQAWIKAQNSDPGFITEYAAKHPQKEDLPESALFAYTLLKTPDRLPRDIQQAIHETMPHRLEYFRILFQSLE